MREYLTALLLVSAVTAVLSFLSGEGATKKGVQFALSLVVLAAVVLPLPGLVGRIPDEYGDVLDRLRGEYTEGEDYWQAATLAAVEEGIALHLCERYGLLEGELSVSALGDIVDGTVILHRVTLSVRGGAWAADLPGMIRYVEENTGAECEVIYRGDGEDLNEKPTEYEREVDASFSASRWAVSSFAWHAGGRESADL